MSFCMMYYGYNCQIVDLEDDNFLSSIHYCLRQTPPHVQELKSEYRCVQFQNVIYTTHSLAIQNTSSTKTGTMQVQ